MDITVDDVAHLTFELWAAQRELNKLRARVAELESASAAAPSANEEQA